MDAWYDDSAGNAGAPVILLSPVVSWSLLRLCFRLCLIIMTPMARFTPVFRCVPAALVILLLTGCGSRANRPEDSAEDAATGPASGTAEVAPDTLRVMAYNIHHGEGMDEVVNLERIARLIRDVDPDLVALQEVDSVVVRTDGVDQAAELGRLTGMQPLFGRFMAYQGGAYGMALLSRLPIRSSMNYRLPDGEEPRTALSAVVELPVSDRHVRFVGIHFYRTEQERLAQAMKLEDLLRGEAKLPTILAGDFNSTPESAVPAHLEKSWHVLDKGEDHLTFPSYGPEREIDYFMWRPPAAFSALDQEVLDEPVISDHRPLVVDLVVDGVN
jgi:endonuclease/exonuclease/phosphatase family metal-dependent hydrolase